MWTPATWFLNRTIPTTSYAVTFATQDIMRMPRAARFHRIKKQAKTSNGQYSAWCSEVGEKNKLTSVGFMNFGKDNRKQQRNFRLNCSITKHITGFWTFKLALFGKFLILFTLFCELTWCFTSVVAHLTLLKKSKFCYALFEVVVQEGKIIFQWMSQNYF